MEREEWAAEARAELRQRLQQNSLGRVEDVLMDKARYSIRLKLTSADEGSMRIGSSKMGGCPDLPPHVPWPDVSGRPMAFIAQINLQEAAAYDVESVLPSSGLLLFFVDDPDDVYDDEAFEDDPPDAPSSHVLYLTQAECMTLTRQPWPTMMLEDYRYTSAAIEMHVMGTLPDPGLQSIRTLLTEQEWQAYMRIQVGPVRDEPRYWHWLLGYAFSLTTIVHLDHFASTQRWDVDGHTFTQALQGKGDPVLVERMEREGADWRLLLQVSTNSVTRMDWYGGGVLHFVMPGQALAAHDFSFVSAAVQSL